MLLSRRSALGSVLAAIVAPAPRLESEEPIRIPFVSNECFRVSGVTEMPVASYLSCLFVGTGTVKFQGGSIVGCVFDGPSVQMVGA